MYRWVSMTTAIHQPHLQPCTEGSTDDIGAAKSIFQFDFLSCKRFECGLNRLKVVASYRASKASLKMTLQHVVAKRQVYKFRRELWLKSGDST